MVSDEIKDILGNTGIRFSNPETFDKTHLALIEIINRGRDDRTKEIHNYRDLLMKATSEIETEVLSAIKKHKRFNSLHEAHSVILEELDELWDEIKVNPDKEAFSLFRTRKEATQCASMLVRLMCELT